jgi:pimeloyl-ACP methyl ester carboxylesterase
MRNSRRLRLSRALLTFLLYASLPVLAIGGEKADGELLGRQRKRVATDATVIILKNAGHWMPEGSA